MTTHTNRKSLSATAGVAVLLGALLAGCSGGADVEAFCTDAQAVQDEEFLGELDPANADSVKTVTDKALEQIKAVEAPKEIADDWSVLSDAMVTFLNGMQDLDLTSEDVMDDMTALTDQLTSEDIDAAGDKVDAFIAENCEA